MIFILKKIDNSLTLPKMLANKHFILTISKLSGYSPWVTITDSWLSFCLPEVSSKYVILD